MPNATERVTKYCLCPSRTPSRAGEDYDFFLQFSPRGYALGVNVVLYALTH